MSSITQRYDAPRSSDESIAGSYEIIAGIAEGGASTVYRARQLSTGQLVALKILRGAPSDAAPDLRVARFLREARLCGQLRHPHIVPVIDAGQTIDGTSYIAFALVPGDTLAALLAAEGALAPREAARLMLQVLDALACAHAAGVVHRDLKPSNILVTAAGARRNAVVLDFGIGAELDGPAIAHGGDDPESLGTPGYGAPEQWRGAKPSPRADLFSWGLVFLECLTGAAIYGLPAAAAFYRMLGPDPVPMPDALASHPLGALIARAVHKDVATRDVTARGLAEALDACDLAGLSRDVIAAGPATGRVRAGMPASRGEPRPLAGRGPELAQLLERWARAAAGAGQAILITGEPGIGKSRLARELCDRIESAPHRLMEVRCSPDTQHSALAPVIELVERGLGLDQETGTAAKASRLDRELGRHGIAPGDAMPLLLALLGLPIAAPYRALDVSPQRHKALTLQAIESLVFAMAREHPILLLAEDLHWADATTMEFLGQLVRDAPDVPLCVCMTARPELVSSLAPTGTSTIPLGRLDRGQIEAMLGALVDDKALPAAAIAHIADRADGVPLFIEELLRTMIDAEILVERGDHYDATGPLSTAAIPATLNALLTARLDRIPRVKGTAQLAAALGREFSVELLAATSGCEPAAVAADLDSLMRAGVMLRKRRGKATIGLFKHALMRDAAYESLSPGARQLVHARIAETLEARFPDVVRTRPDLLAHHHSAAAQMRPAVGYAQRAAELGLQRSTYTEAIAHASNAAAWAHALPGGEAIAAELAANGALIQALMATRGWADLKVKAAADRSTSLLDQLELDSPHRVPTLWFLFTYHHVASHRRNAREVTEQLVALAERSGDQGLGAVAATAHGLALFVDGDHGRARRIAGGAIALYDPARHRDHGPVYGSDSLVLAKTCMAQFCWHAGDDDEAFALVASAIQWARDIGHGPSIALGLLYGCFLHQFAGHTGAVAALAGEILAMSAKYGLPAYEAYAATFHAWATGDGSRIELVVSTLTSLGCKLGLSYYTSLVADGHAARGQLDAAIACIDHCLQLCRDNDEHFYEPELYRRLARYEAQRCPGSEAVRAALAQAVQRARRQQIPRVEAEALGELVRGFEHDHDDHARLEQLRTQYPGLRETAILQARKQGATHG